MADETEHLMASPANAERLLQSIQQAERGETFAPGTFGCHEVLHMAHVCTQMVSEYLTQHPSIEAVPEWKALADQAEEALADLYQAIGAAHLDAPDQRPGTQAAVSGGAG